MAHKIKRQTHCNGCGEPLRAVLNRGKPTGREICIKCKGMPGQCPLCGGELRSKKANQCPKCFSSWHLTVLEAIRRDREKKRDQSVQQKESVSPTIDKTINKFTPLEAFFEVVAWVFIASIGGGFFGFLLGLFTDTEADGAGLKVYIASGIACGILAGIYIGLKNIFQRAIVVEIQQELGVPDAFPALKQAFKNKDLSVLIEAVKHGNPHERLAAVKLLKRIGEEAAPAVPVLIQAVPRQVPRTNAPPVPEKATQKGRCTLCGKKLTAWNSGLFSKKCTACTQLKKNPLELRKQAVHALGRIGPAAKRAVPFLSGVLMENDVELAKAVAEALRRIDPKQVSKHGEN